MWGRMAVPAAPRFDVIRVTFFACGCVRVMQLALQGVVEGDILATKSHEVVDPTVDPDRAFFLDCDMSILGAPRDGTTTGLFTCCIPTMTVFDMCVL